MRAENCVARVGGEHSTDFSRRSRRASGGSPRCQRIFWAMEDGDDNGVAVGDDSAEYAKEKDDVQRQHRRLAKAALVVARRVCASPVAIHAAL